MKDKAAIVIAVLMITSIAFAFSTTSVSATHDETPSIDEDTVKAGTPMVLTITVQNAGPDAIDNVWIIVPSRWDPAPTIKIFKDNIVTLENSNENIVTLPAGTLIELPATVLVKVVENTPVIILSGTDIHMRPESDNQQVTLTENLSAKIINQTMDDWGATIAFVDNFTFSIGADNVRNVNDILENVENSTARLLADTQVVRVADNVVRLPENTRFELVSQTIVNIGTDNRVTLENEESVTLDPDNTIDGTTDNLGRIFRATSTANTDTIYIVQPNDNVLIYNSGSSIVFPAGTEVILENLAYAATLFENTEVIRAANENVRMTAATATATENQPINWTQATGTSTLPPGSYVEWTGIGDNQIASGDPLDFPFAITTPSAGGDYTIYVKTTDVNGVTIQKEVTLTVDNVRPTVTIAASPSWVKDNVRVTITVTASEPLARLENVMVAENNAPENTQITMTPNADNTVWTGTYTTGDNSERDGTATIYVIGTQFEDLVGNVGYDNTGTFTVDRLAPPTPELGAITGFPTTPTNVGTWFIENIAEDNFLGSLVAQEGMTVKIRVGTAVDEITTPASGYYSQSITLTEGIQEVGIQYVDKAGNEGTEKVENITYDVTAPGIDITSPAAGAMINDNAPLISLTITDVVMGVENDVFSTIDNSGYEVLLRQDNDNAVLATLTPITPPTSDPFNSFVFENQWPTDNALPSEVWYNIFVQAGDNLQKDNMYFRFYIDVTPPVWTPGTAILRITLYDPDTMDTIQHVTKKTTWLIEGEAQEPKSTMYIYVDDIEKGSVQAGTDRKFSVSITLDEGKGQKVYIKEVDQAGNESDKVLYGTYTVDKTPPVISLTEPADGATTDESGITVSGTVSDMVTDYDELAVNIDCTGALVLKIVYLNPDGSFSTTVPLTEGSNIINVIARDGAGNQTISTVTVTCTVTPWATYAIIIVIVALILAAIAIFRKR